MTILDRFRRSKSYELWRFYRETEQTSRFMRLLTDSTVSGKWSLDATKRALKDLRTRRRVISQRPSLVAFGARHWEGQGFWQAFEGASNFALFEYGSATTATPSTSGRADLGRRFLDFIEARERRAPVAVTFFYASGAYIDPATVETLRQRGIWTVLMSLDDKQQMPGTPIGDLAGWQLEAARAVDLYWTTWRGGVDWLWAHGVRPWYAPEGASPAFFAPRPVAKDIDVLWVGRAYGSRLNLLAELSRRGFDVRAYGPGWGKGPVDFDEMIRLYSRARVVLGMGGVGQTDRIKHLKGRDFEVPMTGAAYLTSFNPELTDHFVVGSEILCYASLEECVELLSWALRRPELLASVGAAGRARCLRDHTWERRVSELLSMLDGK